VLGWLLNLQKKLKGEGKPVTPETITDFAWATLKAGQASGAPPPTARRLARAPPCSLRAPCQAARLVRR
jgi:hypothetical protein